MSEILYPTSYKTRLVTIDELFSEHHVDKMHPEFARRLRCWLVDQGGNVGIGGSWRDTGAQPDKPGFAPEGQSFHQYQKFASGLIKFSAVDLVVRDPGKVHRSPKWSEVPVQGSEWAKKYGVHANVGAPGQPGAESWHMQCVEIDGWASWDRAGHPDPVSGYPIPEKPNYPSNGILIPKGEELEMIVNQPHRAYDSRSGAAHKAGETRKVKVASAKAAFVNIVAVSPEDSGYLTLWGDGARPNSSHLNFTKGVTIANGVWVPVMSDGSINIYTHKGCHIVVDVLATA
jgi:hypothetical protein